MRRLVTVLIAGICGLAVPFLLSAQTTQTTFNYGVWQTFGDPLNTKAYPEIKGRLCNFNWKDIEPSNNAWAWDTLDSEFRKKAKDSLPFIFMIYTEEGAPDWLYNAGVPKVAQQDGASIVYTPYYAHPKYREFFKRMVTRVRQYVDAMPDSVRKWVIGVQGCFGSTGDYIAYKGTVDPQYALTDAQFFELFKEFSQHYYNEYATTYPKIYLLSNPKNNGENQLRWLLENCPNGWLKCGTLGKGFQLNDEVTKAGWLYSLLNNKQNGEYLRARSELQFNPEENGWWREYRYRNMFALMTYSIFWGLDWSNQAPIQLMDHRYDLAFDFYNKYAGQKDAATATNAMCALRDGLDAADTIRFPVRSYGIAARSDTTRYKNIMSKYTRLGARQEDAIAATLFELNNIAAKGINDVGWDVFPGNYERYLHQLNANETSIGFWNINAFAEPDALYGKYARGISNLTAKNTLYFDVDSIFLGNQPLNGSYPVVIDITYLDSGYGGFVLFYDAKINTNKPGLSIQLTNSGTWKKASVTLYDAYFGNRATNKADFYIKAGNNQTVLFSIVELARPDLASPKVGLHTSGPVLFDTVCTKAAGVVKSFTLQGYFLNGSPVTIKPFPLYSFSLSPAGVFTDSLIISNYGTGISTPVYVKFNPQKTGLYNGAVAISGGGYNGTLLLLQGAGVNSRPVLSPIISNVSCNNARNGAIDLSVSGGAGPFSYNWQSDASLFQATTQDIASLSPATYTVTVKAFAGCTVTAAYRITQPAVLSATIIKDSDIVCKNGTTTVKVTANGGTLPYYNTGSFTVSTGNISYTVTDAKGCTAQTEKLSIAPGLLLPPSRPESITGNDAAGVCNGGIFKFSAAMVPGAASYTWTVPAGTVITKTTDTRNNIALYVPPGFTEGNLLLTADNRCGSSTPVLKTITALPAKPDSINGPALVVPGSEALLYTVRTVLPLLAYNWSSSTGTKITGGQNTPSVLVTWGATDGKVNVKATNNCGSSGPATIDVKVIQSLSAANNTAITFEQENNHFYSPATVVPNPANARLLFIFNAPSAAVYELAVSDVSGRVMQRIRGTAIAGTNRENINIETLARGAYFITCRFGNGKTTTVAFLKQ